MTNYEYTISSSNYTTAHTIEMTTSDTVTITGVTDIENIYGLYNSDPTANAPTGAPTGYQTSAYWSVSKTVTNSGSDYNGRMFNTNGAISLPVGTHTFITSKRCLISEDEFKGDTSTVLTIIVTGSYRKLTYDSKKVQVESAIRDGEGVKISTNYAKKATTLAGYGITDADTSINTNTGAITIKGVTTTPLSADVLQNYVQGPSSSTADHVATYSSATGKVIKDSGFTIAKSVPADAVFTDTTDTAGAGAVTGTKLFLVGRSAQSTGTSQSNANCYIGTDNCLYSGGTKVLTAHQAVVDSNPTLSWGTTSQVGTVGGTALQVTMPANPNTDIKVRQQLTSANYDLPLVLANTANTNTTTNIDNITYRNNSIYANPSTGNIQATKFNGYTLGAACQNGVDNKSGTGSLMGLTTWAASTNLVTRNTIAYWDGRYQTTNNSSNLTYCVKGAFGDACTYAVETTVANDSKLTTGSAITSALKKYSIEAGFNANQSLSSAWNVKVLAFGTPSQSTASWYTVSGSKITVPKAGWYFLHVCVLFRNSAEITMTCGVKSGNNGITQSRVSGADYDNTANISTIVYLSASTQLEFYINGESTAPFTESSLESVFKVVYLGSM